MSKVPGRPSVASVLAALAIVLLGVAVHEYRATIAAYEDYYESVRPRLTRSVATDRLIGAVLPDLSLVGLDGSPASLVPPDTRSILWYIRVGECPSCLGQALARWRGLIASVDMRSAIVLAGASVDEARRLARGANIESTVLVDSASVLERTLGSGAPFVSVVLNERGVVLLADARFAGTESRCGWSFFEQVRAVFGGAGGDRIRAVARVAS